MAARAFVRMLSAPGALALAAGGLTVAAAVGRIDHGRIPPSRHFMETTMPIAPGPEHEWLQRMVGEWTYEMDSVMEPGGEPVRHTGTESVRTIGGLWVVCEGRMQLTDGSTGTTIMTLGYDPARARYVGTFMGSMMTDLWVYDGQRGDGNALVLDTEGPSFTHEGRRDRFRDVVRLDGDDRRTLTSSTLGDDGRWSEFMTMRYRRAG